MQDVKARARTVFDCEVRAGLPTDYAYIASTWVSQFIEPAGMHLRLADPEKVRQALMPKVMRLIRASEILVAAPAEEDGRTVLGFLVHVRKEGLIHLVYVRKAWRSAGLCTRLLDAGGYRGLTDVDFSTPTVDWVAWMRHKWAFGDYRPFWLMEEHTNGRTESH